MDGPIRFSAPGRTEIGGNHTDHQHGCVLAAAVDLKVTAQVRLNGTGTIRVRSQGYDPVEIDTADLQPHEAEKNTTAALVRGVAAAFSMRGAQIRGFDAEVRSAVPPGSGLSSSAAFEVLLGTVLNELFLNGALTPVEIAQIGQWAENVYFGKPCGLMDQMACAVGGAVFMDFADPQKPVAQRLSFDLAAAGYALCIVDSGADHADLTADYAAIPEELSALCRLFDRAVLREIPEETFFSALPEIRRRAPDRALLRAIHFYQEQRRVQQQAQALRQGDLDAFFGLVNASGRSSWMYLQNVIPAGAAEHQAAAVALAVCDTLLSGRGAHRIHGGGFAGTVQAFVPLDMLSSFQEGVAHLLGPGRCRVLSLCPQGGRREDGKEDGS